MFNSLIACGLYYYFWATLLPNWKGYQLRSEAVTLDNGVQSHEIRKVPVSELDEWEATHDVTGRLRQRAVLQSEVPEKESPISSDSEAKV